MNKWINQLMNRVYLGSSAVKNYMGLKAALQAYMPQWIIYDYNIYVRLHQCEALWLTLWPTGGLK